MLDFGISKVTPAGGSQHDISMTRTSALMGSPLYMSPEQLQASRFVDARSDIWAIGVVLFELLSAKVPFEGELVTDLAIKIATSPPLSLRALGVGVPLELERVVMRCLEKDRERRFRDVGELASALEPFAPRRVMASAERIHGTLRGATQDMARAPSARMPGPPSEARTMATWGQTGPLQVSKRRSLLLGAAATATSALVASAAILLGRGGAQPASHVTAASLTTPGAVAVVPVPAVPPSVAPAPEPPVASAPDVPAVAVSEPPSVSAAPVRPPASPPPANPPVSRSATSPPAAATPSTGKRGYNPLEHL